jgi:hypothetical protein
MPPTGANITVSEAGLNGVRGSAFRMPAESSGTLQTGVALTNIGLAPASVTFEPFRQDGISLGTFTVSGIPAGGHLSKFLGEMFPNLPTDFRGLLRITTTDGELSVIGLRTRINERSEFLFTTTPAIPDSQASGPTVAFPHFVNGGGYTTQFILFNNGTNSATSGALQFFSVNGTPLPVTLK